MKLKWEEEADIDVFVEVGISEKIVCEVGFYNQRCEGVSGKFEKGEETITFEAIGKHKYLIYVG